ncbi:hypothetical protein MLD38_019933 [Melastoma candidum]|uniref:Uncharacterized protein n=1 Tax=Melastoma candidum TaxID=119954 RepID=A0ACB9QJB4_9MYRT|nr:hypothetical protein MLD38_019933 [Melastoma candidum]
MSRSPSNPPLQAFLTPTLLLLTFSFSSLVSISHSQAPSSCSGYSFPDGNSYASCIDLPVLGSFLHWNFTPSTSTADVAFRRPSTAPSQWISWAVNPSGGAMVGSQSLVAYLTSSGSVYAYTSSVDSVNTDLHEGNLSFPVPILSGSYRNDEMTIFARLQLGSVVGPGANQVWQVGSMRSDGVPGVHPFTEANMRSVMKLDFSSKGTNSKRVPSGNTGENGASAWTGPAEYDQRRRNFHGVLNAVSWGTLMPAGMIFARYLKVFKSADPAWFYLHTACQTSAYAVGVFGWITGRRLGGNYGSSPHGNIGLVLVILGTLQVLALLIRPKPNHRLRPCWNVYHHSCGYVAIALSIFNVYIGLEKLDPGRAWTMTYSGILAMLGATAVTMEVITWVLVIRRKKRGSYQFSGINGMN